MLDVLRGDTIRGVVFSNYNEFGYQNLYSFPPPIEELDVHLPIDKSLYQQWQQDRDQFFTKSSSPQSPPPTKRFGGLRDIALYTERDFLQIAVKSISLLIGEKVLEKDPSLLDMKFYGILPYPDLQVYSYTFFRFYSLSGTEDTIPRACTFSLLIDKAKKNFIYDNHDFLKELIQNTVNSLVVYLEKGEWTSEDISKNIIGKLQEIVLRFFYQLLPLSGSYSNPSPLDLHRSKKIVFTGLKDSGKNSFLLTLNQKYSKLINKESYQDGDIHMANILGTTVLNWEMDSENILPEHITAHSEIYLHDADMIYFFVDGSDLLKIEESQKLFKYIIHHLIDEHISIPVILIISKIDKEILDNPTILQNIDYIKTHFTDITTNYTNSLHFFETSIFSLSSCLSAFSSGISLLLGAHEKVVDLLKTYTERMKLSGIMLFNEFGLLFSNYISDENNLKQRNSSDSFEILGSHLINIFEKSQTSVISSETSTIKANLGNNQQIILKKIQAPISFYIILFCASPPTNQFFDHLNQLSSDLMTQFVK
ncbi:MAG: hypothetical protein ACTSRE_07805 [Promethearchaeota archaeon]